MKHFIEEFDYSVIKGKCYLVDEIMFYVNRFPEVKEGLKKDLNGWDGNPATLNNALLKIKAYPVIKGIFKKVEEYAKSKLADKQKVY